MSTPNPRPAPGPAPKRHPSGKGYVPSDDTKKTPDDVENKKKIAIDHVVSTFNSARADIFQRDWGLMVLYGNLH